MNMMRNKSTLAKLLSEEDIFVVHKKMETAYFNPKSRELGLPIWKDENMTDDIYDLMVCHEIGHALWTPLDMLEKAKARGLNHSFVNIIEDARIEAKVKSKYLGTPPVFKRGYVDLVSRNFFGTDEKEISKLGLIDRINIFFKSGDKNIPFLDIELPWVKRVAECVTPEDVLDLAEEMYKFMEENPETMGENSEDNSAGPTSETGDEEENTDGVFTINKDKKRRRGKGKRKRGNNNNKENKDSNFVNKFDEMMGTIALSSDERKELEEASKADRNATVNPFRGKRAKAKKITIKCTECHNDFEVYLLNIWKFSSCEHKNI